MSLNTPYNDPEVIGNYIEGVFWIVVGIVVLIAGYRANPAYRRISFLARVTFMIFGVSDFVEAQTGAWWRPLWLLVWKGSCLIILAWCYWKYRGTRARLSNQEVKSCNTNGTSQTVG